MSQQEHKISTYKSPRKEDVQQMFDGLAPTYDRLNHRMSLGVDEKWRKKAIDFLGKQIHPTRILDVATGTGDLSIMASKMLHPKQVIGIDISEKMMEVGKEKVSNAGLSDCIHFQLEDCSALTFPDNSFDSVISSFGLRNFEHLDKCLSEMHRVMVPGGWMVVIDLCTPRKFPMKQLFWCYRKLVMPVMGKHMTKDDSAYNYLPHSMDIIPQGPDMCERFRQAGFTAIGYKRLAFQMCVMYYGSKDRFS